MNLRVKIIVIIVLVLVIKAYFADIGAATFLADVVPDKIIYVDNQHFGASDSNPGNMDHPLATLNAAGRAANDNRKKGYSTKIIVYPGIYRESIRLTFGYQENDPLIIFEAKEAGTAIVSGSDVWTNWKKVNDNNVYASPWPYNWGLVPYPPGWKGAVTLEPIVRRREMVFLDYKPLVQVLSFSELREGTFYVSEEEKQIYLKPPSSVNLSNSLVEVAIRSGLLGVKGKTNFALKGLKFIHDASGVQNSAAWFTESSNLLIEDCVFTWNNWTGLGFSSLQSVTTRRNSMKYNGGAGFTAWKVKNLLSEDDETSYNNWRGIKGGFDGWGVAGTKVLRIHDAIFRRHTARGNHTIGFWFDFNNMNILVEDSRWCGNLKHGLVIEASDGPIILRNTRIYQNNDLGVRTSYSSHVTFRDSYIYSNEGFQIWVSGRLLERPVDNWETGKERKLRMEHWTLKDNVVAGRYTLLDIGGATHYLKQTTYDWSHFLDTLASKGNHWYKPMGKSPFSVGGKPQNFSEWQATTNQDSDSELAEFVSRDVVLLPEDCAYSSNGRIP